MAAYKNTNTFDGFFTVIKDGKQYNLRLSRPLLPNPAESRVGPLSLEIVRPFQELRLVVAPGPDHSLAADITFTGTVPTLEEQPHSKRLDGRLVQDYCRFDQIGCVDGWIQIDGERIGVDKWFSVRDHSWGIRPGQGGYEPLTSKPLPGENREDVGAGADGFLIVWLAFETASYAGYLQQHEDGRGRLLYIDGHIYKKEGSSFQNVKVVKIEHEFHFAKGTRVASDGKLHVGLANGETLEIEASPILPPFCYKGTGYDSGYNDERGLGLHRGDLLESDVYDVSHVENVVLPDGRVVRPWHREAGSRLKVNGESGYGHFSVINSGTLLRYGLSAEITNKKQG